MLSLQLGNNRLFFFVFCFVLYKYWGFLLLLLKKKMAIRVVARIRPQQSNELDKDTIVTAARNNHNHNNNNNNDDDDDDDLVVDDKSSALPTLVKIPSHKNNNEIYTFQFSTVYDEFATQQAIFDNEGKCSKAYTHIFRHCLSLKKQKSCMYINTKWGAIINSGAYYKASFQWIRYHNIRIWLDRNRQNSYNARWKVTCRAWGHTAPTIWYLSKREENRQGFSRQNDGGDFAFLLRDLQ